MEAIENEYEQYREFFGNIGFNVDSKGALYFFSALSEVERELANGKTNEEVRELIPSILLEEYHFLYEVPKKKYLTSINTFLKSRNVKDKNLGQAFNLEDYLINYGVYFNSLNSKKKLKKELEGNSEEVAVELPKKLEKKLK